VIKATLIEKRDYCSLKITDSYKLKEAKLLV